MYIQYSAAMSATEVCESRIKCSCFHFPFGWIPVKSLFSTLQLFSVCFWKVFVQDDKRKLLSRCLLRFPPFLTPFLFSSLLAENSKLLKIFTKLGTAFDSDLQREINVGTIIYSKSNFACVKSCSFNYKYLLSWLPHHIFKHFVLPWKEKNSCCCCCFHTFLIKVLKAESAWLTSQPLGFPVLLIIWKEKKKEWHCCKIKHKQKKLTCMSRLHVFLKMDICFPRVTEPVTMINCSFSAKHKIWVIICCKAIIP